MPRITCEELNSVWEAKLKLEREQRNLLDLKIMARPPAGISTSVLDGMPHSKPAPCNVERIAELILNSQKLIADFVKTLEQRKFDLLTKLQALNLNELQQRVLSYHYVACLKFNEIAKLMNFTKDYTHYLHRHGLCSLGLSISEMNKLKPSSSFVNSSSLTNLASSCERI